MLYPLTLLLLVAGVFLTALGGWWLPLGILVLIGYGICCMGIGVDLFSALLKHDKK